MAAIDDAIEKVNRALELCHEISAALEPRGHMNRGICIGGPHDGHEAKCKAEYFNVVLKKHPDVKNPDGTLSRKIEYDTYYWVSQSKTWRWGTSG